MIEENNGCLIEGLEGVGERAVETLDWVVREAVGQARGQSRGSCPVQGQL